MGKSQLPEEFKEFIRCLNENKVRYLLIGGWAVGMYSTPRFTADIDFLIDSKAQNLEKIINALSDFGIRGVQKEFFLIKDNVFRIGRPPMKIDILNHAKGIDFDECYSHKKKVSVDGINLKLISKQDLIKSKKSTKRPKDLADLAELQK